MKKTLFSLLLIPLWAQAQTNLVPNPSFEEYKQLPCSCMGTNINEYLNNWNCASDGTADFMTDLAGADCYANPTSKNSQGFQAARTGHAMGFIYNYCSSMDYREYVGVTLKSPLVVGQKYYAEMYVSLTDYMGIATNNVGICFFTGELQRTAGYPINANPQINSTEVITDSKGWVKISGTFTADKAYTYLVIGNFFDSENTKTQKVDGEDPLGSRGGYSGYYIDDVVVKATAINLAVRGDTLVAPGTVATLIASGSFGYKWADATKPKVILGDSAVLKIPVNVKRTFIVYDNNGNSKKITVNVTTPPVYMQTLNDRKVKKGSVVKVHNEKVKITVYDNNKIDGDSISLYYGDSCIVSNLKLTQKKKTFTITIDKTHPRQLILYAVNLGSQPPNTAAIIIGDGRESINVMLSSDLKASDAVMLAYVQGP